MKISEAWLREWVNPDISIQDMNHVLTMAGLEVEEIAPVAPKFTGVVVAEVVSVDKHPEADRLHVCMVKVKKSATAKPLQIVCGATNVKAGMKAVCATVGAKLTGDFSIESTKLRGVQSDGMLCSLKDLGMADESNGLFELPSDAPLGADVRDYLDLDDETIDVGITPNRGDCLSAKGMARDLGAATKTKLSPVKIIEVRNQHRDTLAVKLTDTDGCPHYVGRVIRNIDKGAQTPIWMVERLRRSGIRSIHPVVDVTNYVMLELGQPMHAFDLSKINGSINVRLSKKGEKIDLLDESSQTLDNKTLVIADDKNSIAIAGVMGGTSTCVDDETTDIFLESAFFSPTTVARQRQYYNLNSDSAYRFERGVDPNLQKDAIERATALILKISGGEPGPVTEKLHMKSMPKRKQIKLSDDLLRDVLGVVVPSVDIKRILTALGFECKRETHKWLVTPPTWRFDVSIPEDVIEEIARLYGYDKIPTTPMSGVLHVSHVKNEGKPYWSERETLSNLGFHEIVSYSFIDKKLHELLGADEYRELDNPITSEMSVMRTNLWGGLINSLIYNTSRQQNRVKLFEIGACFNIHKKKLVQQPKLAGLISGDRMPEQWAAKSEKCDFYDLKGAVDYMLTSMNPGIDIQYAPTQYSALHPGQAAQILVQGKPVGVMGALHPSVMQALDLTEKVFVFQIELSELAKFRPESYQDVSKFPEIRRDLAILIDQAIPSVVIQDTIRDVAGDWLKECFIFDVYQGKGISPDKKSVALALVIQHPERTLVDQEVVELTDRVVSQLREKLGAELRS